MACCLGESNMAAASSLVIGEPFAEVPVQGIKKNGFGLPVELINIPSLGATLGLSHINPVGCLITGALKTGNVNKRFG